MKKLVKKKYFWFLFILFIFFINYQYKYNYNVTKLNDELSKRIISVVSDGKYAQNNKSTYHIEEDGLKMTITCEVRTIFDSDGMSQQKYTINFSGTYIRPLYYYDFGGSYEKVNAEFKDDEIINIVKSDDEQYKYIKGLLSGSEINYRFKVNK